MSKQANPSLENKMGTMGENKLLLSISIPMMFSMMIQALYNVVDSIFVGQISENALTAVSLTFPIQVFMIAVSVGTGIGINALLSRNLGENDTAMASKCANVGVFLNLVSSLLFMAIGLIFSRIFFEMQIDVPEIIDAGQDYMFYTCVFCLGCFGQVVYSRLLQSTGKTFHSMIIQLVGAVLNIILDPILIFGFFGCPAMGVKGAAIATVIGQFVAMFLGLYLNVRYNKDIKLSFRMMKPNWLMVKRIYAIGIPSIIMQTTASIMSFAFNAILLSFSGTAVAVFGVYYKVQSFFFMPVFGLNNGIVSIIAYNYGAQKPDRIVKTTKLSLIYATSILALGFLSFQFFPAQMLSLFNASPDMLAIGTAAFRLISPFFLMAGFVIVCTSVLQAVGWGFSSMVISLVRQLVVLVPLGYLFSLSGNLSLVWLSFPCAEFVAMVLAAINFKRLKKKIILPMREAAKKQQTSLAEDTVDAENVVLEKGDIASD